jgi:Holliday junction DNA helicase RuvA
LSRRDWLEAILQERINELTAIKGIGRKTAERLVLDLRDKVRLSASAEGEDGKKTAAAGTGEEAAMALMTLGYTASTARQAVHKAIEKHGAGSSVQQLIKQALKER